MIILFRRRSVCIIEDFWIEASALAWPGLLLDCLQKPLVCWQNVNHARHNIQYPRHQMSLISRTEQEFGTALTCTGRNYFGIQYRSVGG